MRIAGTGIDIIEVSRIADALARLGDRFIDRVFTTEESSYCRSCGVPAQHFAARFAAKEAVFKALGTGWSRGMAWRDIEITRTPAGGPDVRLEGGAARRAQQLGIVRLHLSISHAARYAVAQAVAEAADR